MSVSANHSSIISELSLREKFPYIFKNSIKNMQHYVEVIFQLHDPATVSPAGDLVIVKARLDAVVEQRTIGKGTAVQHVEKSLAAA
jgi:hypothetical protein